MKKFSKTEAEKRIAEFFKDIENNSPKEIKKIKKFAMSHNIPLRKLRKKFCKKCFTPYKNPKIRIDNKIKSTICENCSYVSRWKIKN